MVSATDAVQMVPCHHLETQNIKKEKYLCFLSSQMGDPFLPRKSILGRWIGQKKVKQED